MAKLFFYKIGEYQASSFINSSSQFSVCTLILMIANNI